MAAPNYPDFTAMSDKDYYDYDTSGWLSEYQQGLTSSTDFEEGGKYSGLAGQGQYYAPGVWSEEGTTTGIDWDNPDVLDQLISQEDIQNMSQDDRNALFQGTGKYEGMLGSFKCELVKDNNITFHLSGMNDDIRRNYKRTHKVGTIITFSYLGLTQKGVPINPIYVRKRN